MGGIVCLTFGGGLEDYECISGCHYTVALKINK